MAVRWGGDGWTMIEVVVVCGIVATLFGLTWAARPLSGRLAAQSAAAMVVSDIRAAQAKAIAERRADRSHGLQFAVGAERYFSVTRTGGATAVLGQRALPRGVRVTYARFGGGPDTSVLFGGTSLFGAPSGGGTVTLTSGATRMCVRVIPATGRVRVAAVGCP